MAVTDAETETACLESCQQTSGCEWFTFDVGSKKCVLTRDCDFVDETCGDGCVHGLRSCLPTDNGMNGDKLISCKTFLLRTTKQSYVLHSCTICVSNLAICSLLLICNLSRVDDSSTERKCRFFQKLYLSFNKSFKTSICE